MTGLELAKLIPWIAALGAAVCGLLCAKPHLRGLAGWVCVLAIAAGFGLTVNAVLPFATGKQHFEHYEDSHVTVGHVETVSPWIQVGGENVEQIAQNDQGETVKTIIDYAGGLQVDYGYYFDGLTFTMMLVVCGIGMLIAIYAVGYMRGDPGVARFFAAMALFIFAMTTLVMADNLVLLFLGWEGVGLCSYLLIGYYYGKTTAVDAAKKAFIVNRIGDLGFLVGIFLCFKVFGSLQFADILPAVQAQLGLLGHDPQLAPGAQAAYDGLRDALLIGNGSSPWLFYAIPFCLMVGAFGKSAQIPLFVWLPDAMAGPTPVSALVHAATMVTAGVYLIARCMPLFVLGHEHALDAMTLSPLHVVAAVGGVTAIFAATIALTNNDLKGVFAYSTVSQLGYMFLGLGALSATSGVFHLVTHAFFKALLFLTAGSVMHALAGTLDIRKMGGMGRHMPVTKWLMFAGCLALAGFPFTAGFFSKDEILAAAMIKGLEGDATWTRENVFYFVLALMGLATALLTAFYTFRLWFIVFTGETKYEMGAEHHADEGEAEGKAEQEKQHHHAPHEMPWWPMNLPLVVLVVGALTAGFLLAPPKFLVGDAMPQVMHNVMHQSSAHVELPASHHPAEPHAAGHTAEIRLVADTEHAGPDHPSYEHAGDADHAHHGPPILGFDAHNFMMALSTIIALLGIGLAWLFYNANRALPGKCAAAFGSLTDTLRGKYYIDELYDKTIVQPLNVFSQVLFLIDQLVVHATVMGVGLLPGNVGKHLRKTQTGKLQGYGLGMLAGIAAVALFLFLMLNR